MMPLYRIVDRRLLLFPLALLLMLSGCARWNLQEKFFPSEEPPPVMPERLLPMWTDTVLYQAGEVGVRGFGARIYFYGEEEEPIEVDGGLTVYAFDAEKPDGRMPVPEKKFVFTPEQLETHHSQTNMGHSYSVWLPWDEVGGTARHISLVARFESREGGVVVSEPIRKLLPGAIAADSVSSDGTRSADGGVQPASYEETEKPESITIQVPPSFANKLKGESSRSNHSGTNRLMPLTEPAKSETRQPTSDPAPDEADPAGSFRRRLSDHFERTRLRAREDTTPRQHAADPRRQPDRAGWRSGLPRTPRSPGQ